MSNTLVLERFAYSPDGTFGKLHFPTGEDFYTVEKPWKGNAVEVSCIPEGSYSLGLRYSPLVERLTKQNYDEAWEVQDVDGRTHILIHQGNWPNDFKGCIGLGLEYSVMNDRMGIYRNGVTRSATAFREFMELMSTRGSWLLDIRPKLIEYP